MAEAIARDVREERVGVRSAGAGTSAARRSCAKHDRSRDRRGSDYGAPTGCADRAICRVPGRKMCATSIAEHRAIEGVRVVVDSGLARVPRFEPAVAMSGSRPGARARFR